MSSETKSGVPAGAYALVEEMKKCVRVRVDEAMVNRAYERCATGPRILTTDGFPIVENLEGELGNRKIYLFVHSDDVWMFEE